MARMAPASTSMAPITSEAKAIQSLREGSFAGCGSTHVPTSAPVADFFTVWAKTSEKEIAPFLVPRETNGLKVGRRIPKMGVKASVTSEVSLDAVPATCLLGEDVRYDGGHKRDRYITDVLGQYLEFVADQRLGEEPGVGAPLDLPGELGLLDVFHQQAAARRGRQLGLAASVASRELSGEARGEARRVLAAGAVARAPYAPPPMRM